MFEENEDRECHYDDQMRDIAYFYYGFANTVTLTISFYHYLKNNIAEKNLFSTRPKN